MTNDKKEPWITLKNGVRVHPSWLKESFIEKNAFDAFEAEHKTLSKETRKTVADQIKGWQDNNQVDVSVAGYASQIGEKLQALKDKILKQAMPKIGSNARITNLDKNPVSMTLTVTYTDGTNQIVDLVSLPKATELQVGMTRAEAEVLLAGAISGTQSFDPLQARAGSSLKQQWRDIYLKQEADDSLRSRMHPVDLGGKFSLKLDPKVFVNSQLGETVTIDQASWADPLAKERQDANRTVAALDEAMDNTGRLDIYKHDRYPSKYGVELIYKAVDLLKARKHIPIDIITLQGNIGPYTFDKRSIHIAYSVDFKETKKRVISDINILHRVFDRVELPYIDKKAGLRGRLKTDDYIALRIAYILLKLAKISDDDAAHRQIEGIEIIGHSTHELFQFS